MERAIGSEKIQDVDKKLARIIEIAGIKNSIKKEKVYGIKPNILHESVASNGDEYAIVQETKYIYIKKKIGDNYEYMSGIQNIHENSYKSYSDALKHLNLMYKSINESVDHRENVDIIKKKI